MRVTAWVATGILSIALCLSASASPGSDAKQSEKKLHDAWDGFIQGLNQAQASLTDPNAFPPQATDRNLAEGYRYLMGHLGRMIELEMRMDPRFPEFHRSVDMLRKWTAENPDAMYLQAPIDAGGYYKVTGLAADTREWRSSARGLRQAKAPRLVTFQTITDVPGSTGQLAEMAQCKNQTLDFANSFTLQLGADDRFEILIGPERPADYRGNFLLSRKAMDCPGTGATAVREARWLTVREIFSDWEYELPLELEILRLDNVGASKPPIDAAFVSEKLDTLARELPNQIRFWNLLQEFALEVQHDTNSDGVRAMPVNAINPPKPPFTAGGVAGAKQFYAGGKFELAADEALVIKVTTPVEPHYIGFQLSTLWFEGPDQQNFVSSLSGHQLPPASDGARYYIVAQQDPGLQGWVATTGLSEGTHSMRFVFRQDPDADQMPTTEASLVKLDRLDEALPADTPRISPQQRADEIAVRQSHIKQRWRGY